MCSSDLVFVSQSRYVGAQHYGWLFTLKELSETSILSVTGDKSLTDLNVIFVFNFMSLLVEIRKEKEQQQRQSQFNFKR